MEHTKVITITGTNRNEYRENLIKEFLKEEPGNNKDVSLYMYYVDTLKEGNRIYLKRPTQLNKGVDFEVRIENVNFRYGKKGNVITTGNRPSHKDIEDDLRAKKEENPVLFGAVKPLLDRIYNCQDIKESEYAKFNFKSGFTLELILKSLKWLFIEQDITYWNRSGRYMLYNSINELWNE